MRFISKQSVILIVATALAFCSVISCTFKKCKDFYMKQKTLMKNEVIQEIFEIIEGRFHPEDITSKITKTVFEDVMKDIKSIYLPQQKLLKEKDITTVMTTPRKFERKKTKKTLYDFDQPFSKIEHPTSELQSFESTHDFKEEKYTHIHSMASRTLKEEEISTACNGTVIRLDLELDGFPTDNSWNLIDAHTFAIVANQTYREEEEFEKKSHQECLDPGPYIFTLFDSFSDGIHCENVISCYNISVDDKIVIIGSPFSDVITHRYDPSSLCLFEEIYSTFLLQVQLDENNPDLGWVLYDDISRETYPLEPTTNVNNNFTSSYFGCVLPGIYSLYLANFGSIATFCGETEECYRVSVNDQIVVNGFSFTGEKIHTIDIFSSGKAIEQQCHKHPLLSPMNHLNDFQYDDRVHKIMFVIYTVSSQHALSNFRTPQYKAACWILFDDIAQISWDNELLVQRYVMAVLIYSIHYDEEILFSNICESETVLCNDQGHVTEINWGKFLYVLLFLLFPILICILYQNTHIRIKS